MYAREENNTIKTYNQIPAIWDNDFAFKKRGESVHKKAGFYPVVQPQITPTEKRVNLHFDEANEVFTYDVEDMSAEELQAEKISNAQFQKDELIRKIQDKKIVEEMQAITDEETLLQNQAVFPIWQAGLELTIDTKIQWFLDGELVLWKVAQPSLTTQEQYKPGEDGTEALYFRIAMPGEILKWKQPLGGHDAYNIGDEVYYPEIGDTIYRSTVNANSFAPGVVQGQWEIV